jgi:hypothetical protein
MNQQSLLEHSAGQVLRQVDRLVVLEDLHQVLEVVSLPRCDACDESRFIPPRTFSHPKKYLMFLILI